MSKPRKYWSAKGCNDGCDSWQFPIHLVVSSRAKIRFSQDLDASKRPQPPNGSLLDCNTYLYIFQGSQIANEDSGMIRLDQRFSDRLAGFVRYNMDESVSNVPLGSMGQKQDIDTRPKNGVVQALQVVSATLTNEYKLGFNQEITHTANLSPLAYTVTVPGFSSIQNSQTKDERGTTFDR